MPTIVSIAVAKVRTLGAVDEVDPMDRRWTTGFFKEPVVGPVSATAAGLVGDEQADLVNHGGPDKAILAYSANHYPAWRESLAMPELAFGAFGENFTIDGLCEDDVCIGDIWTAGEVELEVSQLRQPCWKLARRLRIKDAPAQVVKTGRTGWYLRVRVPGMLSATEVLALKSRPNPSWTIARANDVMHFGKYDAESSADLAAVPGLSKSWRDGLRSRG